MKKHISLILSLILVIVSLFLPQFASDDVEFGKGDGASQEVSTFEEAKAVISSVAQLLSNTSNSNTPYKSISFLFERDTRIKFDISENYGNRKQIEISVKNKTNYYVNDDGDTYIVGTGLVSSVSPAVFADFDAEIYISGKNEKEAYIKITRLEMVSDGIAIPAKMKVLMLNKWIDIYALEEQGVGSLMDMLTEANLNYFELMDKYISDAKEHDGFYSDGDTYKMGSRLFESFLNECLTITTGSLPFDIEPNGELLLDLSDEKAPEISMNVKYKFPSSYGVGRDEVDINSSSSYEKLNYKFYNINNTEVDFDVDEDEIYDYERIQELAKEMGLEE